MKKISLFIFSVFAFLCISCKTNIFDKGSIKITLPKIEEYSGSNNSRAAESEYSFTLNFTNSSGGTQTATGSGGTTVTVALDPDTYTISGEVADDSGNVLYKGETEATVESGVVTEVALVLKKVAVADTSDDTDDETKDEDLDAIYIGYTANNLINSKYWFWSSAISSDKILLDEEKAGNVEFMVAAIADAPIEGAIYGGSLTSTKESDYSFTDLRIASKDSSKGIVFTEVEPDELDSLLKQLEEDLEYYKVFMEQFGVTDEEALEEINKKVEKFKDFVAKIGQLVEAKENVEIYTVTIDPAKFVTADSYTLVLKDYERKAGSTTLTAKENVITGETYSYEIEDNYIKNPGLFLEAAGLSEATVLSSSDYGCDIVFKCFYDVYENEEPSEKPISWDYDKITEKGYSIIIGGSTYSEAKKDTIKSYFGKVPVELVTSDNVAIVSDIIDVLPDCIQVGILESPSGANLDSNHLIYDGYGDSESFSYNDIKDKYLSIGVKDASQSLKCFTSTGSSVPIEASTLVNNLFCTWNIRSSSLEGPISEEGNLISVESLKNYSPMQISLNLKYATEIPAVTYLDMDVKFELEITDVPGSGAGTGGTGTGTGGTGDIDIGGTGTGGSSGSGVTITNLEPNYTNTKDIGGSDISYFKNTESYLNIITCQATGLEGDSGETEYTVLGLLDKDLTVLINGDEYTASTELSMYYGLVDIKIKNGDDLLTTKIVRVHLADLTATATPETRQFSTTENPIAVEVSCGKESYYYCSDGFSTTHLNSQICEKLNVSWSASSSEITEAATPSVGETYCSTQAVMGNMLEEGNVVTATISVSGADDMLSYIDVPDPVEFTFSE